MTLPVVAKCQKCGRDFVTLPKEPAARDPWPDQREWQRTPTSERKDLPPCGGAIIATGTSE